MMKLHPILLAPICLLGVAALPACRTSDVRDQPVMDKHVDNSMLQHVPEGERRDVADARKAADVARDAYAAAKADVKLANDRRKLADRELEIADAELKRAEAAVKVAENGTQDELEGANQGVKDAKALVASARSRIALRDRQVDHAEAIEELKQRNNELAQAKVEATKAHAVKDLDRPQAKTIDIEAFEKQVRQSQEKVEIAKVRVDATRHEVDAARRTYDDHVKTVPASFRRDWPKEDEPKD